MRATLKALALPRREKILRLVWSRERCAGDIAAAMSDVSFGAVSQHLRVLREAGLVEQRRAGRRRFYRARPEGLGPLATYYEGLWGRALESLKELAEAEENDGDAGPGGDPAQEVP